MKRMLIVGFLALCALAAPVAPPAMAAVESDNMFLIGRNAMGPTQAASVYGNYLVMGNGAYLEIYEIFGTRPYKQKRGSILMPDVVKDVYVDGLTAYVACNGAGLITVDISVPGSPFIRGQFDQAQYVPNGQALGVFVFGNRAYVADGFGGLVIIDVSNPAVLNPPVGIYSAPNTLVRDVQVDISGSKTVAYVAADTSGLWTVDVSAGVQNAPVRLARIKMNGTAKAVTLSPILAYVAMGDGGLTQVNITNPSVLWLYRVWKPDGLNLDITDVFVSSFKAYCTDANFGMRILDVSDDISTPISNLSTRGNASRITLTNLQRAFIADGGGGLLMLNLDNPANPVRIDSIQTGDTAKDIAYYGNTLYVAGGRSGLWILNRSQAGPTVIPMAGAGNIDTLRACGGVVVRDTLLFVLNGRNGVKIMSVRNPVQPRMITNIKVPNAAYDVDFDGNRAIIAGGTGGIHIMNILDPRHPTDLGTVSLGAISANKVKVDADRHVAYVATDAGMRVVDLDAKTLIAACPGTNNSFASDLNESKTTLYVADGVNGVLVYDVTNPGTPHQIQGMTYNTPGSANDIRMRGNAAVVADGEGTVRILDMSVSPIEVGFAHTGGASLGVDIDGDTVAVADGEAGIYLFKTNFAGTLASREDLLNFGSVVIGRNRILHLRLTNTGTREIRIQKVSSTSGRFVSGLSSSISIYPSQSYSYPIVFYPTVVQEVTDQIKIESDASNPVVLVDVRGSGLAYTPLASYVPDYSTYLLYHMDSLDGDTLVADDSQYGYLDGRATGATLLAAASSKFNQSLKFTGSTSVQVNLDSADHLPESEGFTVDTWLDPLTAQTGRKTIFRVAQGARSFIELGVRDLTPTKRGLYGLTMPAADDTVEVVSDSTRALKIGEWVHAALVYKTNNRMVLYLNGTPLDTMEVQLSMPTSGLNMKLGSTGEGTGFDGALDEFRLSGVARDPWEFNVCTGRIQMASEGLNFGNILMPNRRTLGVTVRNSGVGQLWVDSVKTTNPRFTVSPSTLTLGPGASQMLWVTFTPNAAGTVNALLSVYSRDPVTPVLSLLLTGFGMTQGTTGAYALDVYTNALWHMDWVKGDTAVTDTSANHLLGRLSASGVTKNAIFPKYGAGSLYFDGATGWVRIPSHAALDFVNSAFTVETWFRMNSKPGADYDVLVRRGVKNNCQYELLYGDSLVNGRGITARVYASNGQAYTLTGSPDAEMNTATWYNAALTWDRGTLRLYQNGLCVDSTAFAGSLRASSEPVAVGGNYGLNAFFNGYIDELRVSNTARLPWEFNVTGPRLYASAETIVFDQILLGESPSTSFQISNGGDQPLSVTGMTWKNRVFSISPNTFKVPTGSAWNVQVAFRPTATGAIRDTLVIASNDPTGPARRIFISATVVDYRAKLAYPLDANTIALYHLDETTGTALNDANANKHNGQLFNAPERITGGYFSGAVRFNGLNQYATVPQSEDISFDPEARSYTFECFFRTDTISEALLYKDISGGLEKPNWGLAIDNTGRLMVPGFGTGSTWVADNAWHHTAFVYDHLLKLGSLYVDGSLQFQMPLTPGVTDTKTKGALTIGAREVATNVFVDQFTGDIDELRISDRARKPWEFLFARSGIDVSLSGTPLAGSAQTVLISIVPVAGSKTLTLFHRKTGETAYASVAASSVNDSTYRAVIPADGVTASGLEFYVQKTAGAGTSTQPVYDPVNRPISASVRFASMASGLTLPAKKYTMISAPAELVKPSVKDVLRDDMGLYDPYTWRLFAWKDTSYAEYSDSLSSADSASFNLSAGKAFWIITSEAKTFDVEAGSSVSSAGPFHQTLKAQWNMVSSPFTFPVSWDDCALSSDSVGTLYAYDGTGYRLDWPAFEPWKGYFVFNAQVRPATIYVPPRKATAGTLPKRGIQNNLADGDWILRLSAETPEARDLDNFVGVRGEAEKTWDVFDRLEPPPMGEYVSLFVDHPDWNRNPGPYAADIRAAGEPGYVWEFTLETRLVGKPVSLKWNLTKALPEGWVAYLTDPGEGVSVNMMEKAGTQVETGAKAPNLRRLRILVGSQEFVDAQSEIPLRPVEFGLSQNYPNPFNPRTTIEYALPKNGRVRLTLYNLLGQRIRVLLDQDEKKGFHKVVWDGDNDRGLRASSGIYIYRLEFLDRVAVRKLVLVK